MRGVWLVPSLALIMGACKGGERAGGAAGEGGSPGSAAGGDAGQAAGGTSTGGSDTGGSDTGGSDTGGSDTGGSDTGGSDTGGTGGSEGGAAGDTGDACPVGATGDAPESYLSQFSSGERLEANYYSVPGVPDIFIGFFDTELGVPCDFLEGDDGRLRCLPRNAARHTHVGYADTACSVSIWESSDACVDSPGFSRKAGQCALRPDVNELLPLTSDVTVHRPLGGNCESAETYMPGPTSFIESDIVSSEEFVLGVARDLAGVCRGTLRIVEAEDGAFGPLDVVDVASGAPCERFSGTCVPKRRGFEDPTLFSDDACSEPAAYGTSLDAVECGPPDFIRPLSSGAYFYETGALFEGELYAGTGTCLPAREQDWITTVYELGEAKEREDFAQLNSQLIGAGRLQANVVGEDDTPLLSGAGIFGRIQYYDTELEAPCAALLFDDGVTRCVPINSEAGGLPSKDFNDDQCTQPIRNCYDDCNSVFVVDQELDDSACGVERPVTAVWSPREPATGYYRMDAGGPCQLVGDPADSQWQVDGVDPDEFVSLTVEVR